MGLLSKLGYRLFLGLYRQRNETKYLKSVFSGKFILFRNFACECITLVGLRQGLIICHFIICMQQYIFAHVFDDDCKDLQFTYFRRHMCVRV